MHSCKTVFASKVKRIKHWLQNGDWISGPPMQEQRYHFAGVPGNLLNTYIKKVLEQK